METQLAVYGYYGLAKELEWAQALSVKYPVENKYSAWKSGGIGGLIGGFGGGGLTGVAMSGSVGLLTFSPFGIALAAIFGAAVVGGGYGITQANQNEKIELTKKVNKIYKKMNELISAKCSGVDDISTLWQSFIHCAENNGFFTAGTYEKHSFTLNWTVINKFDLLGSCSDVALFVLIGLANSPQGERCTKAHQSHRGSSGKS